MVNFIYGIDGIQELTPAYSSSSSRYFENLLGRCVLKTPGERVFRALKNTHKFSPTQTPGILTARFSRPSPNGGCLGLNGVSGVFLAAARKADGDNARHENIQKSMRRSVGRQLARHDCRCTSLRLLL